jgi:RimJ/RimL family protein N-acetyltransferase
MTSPPDDRQCDLSTDRLILKQLLISDAAALFEVLRDLSLYTYLTNAAPHSLSDLERQLHKWEARVSPDGNQLWLNWGVRLRNSFELIGCVQAGVAAETATLAWVIGSRHQRKGYATEATLEVGRWLRDFGVFRFVAYIHPRHQASQRVAARLGLHRTGETSSDGEERWELAERSTCFDS